MTHRRSPVEEMVYQPAALREKLATAPVVKSGLSLMTGTAVTSALGLLFWILAANLYEPASFGVSTTAVYTMMMLADVACLGLRTGLVRHLPKSAKATGRMIGWAYAIVFSASALTGATFLIGLGLWAPDLVELRNSLLLFVFFVASTAFWALFMLEDAVLVGLRKATWVPIENTLFGVLKIVLLVPFAGLSPTLGIFWAWTLPVFPIVIGVNVLVAALARTRSAPASGTVTDQSQTSGERVELDDQAASSSLRPLLRAVLTFSLADWLASLARLVALGIIPLMVLAQTDKAQAGFFQAAWLIAFTLMALSSNAAYALLAETSYDQALLHRNSMQAGVLSLAMTVPVMLIGLIGAPYVLLVYGADYSDNSSALLRILLVAAVPNVIYQVFVGRLRVQGRMAAVVLFETLLSVIVIGLSWLLLPRYGIEGVGMAWLIGLSLLGTYAASVESLWWWASFLDTGLVRWMGARFRRATIGRPARGMDVRLADALEALGVSGAEVRWERSDEHEQTAVVEDGTGQSLEITFARSRIGEAEIAGRRAVTDRLRADPAMADLLPVIPSPVGHSDRPGSRYLALAHRSGTVLSELVEAEEVSVEHACRVARAGIEPLHAATGRATVVDEGMVEAWIEEPISHLVRNGRASAANVGLLREILIEGFVGATVSTGRVQGELTLSNVKVGADRSTVTGLRRWDRSRQLPLLIDAAGLALTTIAMQSADELGGIVRALLEDPTAFEQHPALADVEQMTIPARAVLLLAWLHLVGRPHPPGRTLSSEVFWLARNAQPVLAALRAPAGSKR